jgi:hypothetical protein
MARTEICIAQYEEENSGNIIGHNDTLPFQLRLGVDPELLDDVNYEHARKVSEVWRSARFHFGFLVQFAGGVDSAIRTMRELGGHYKVFDLQTYTKQVRREMGSVVNPAAAEELLAVCDDYGAVAETDDRLRHLVPLTPKDSSRYRVANLIGERNRNGFIKNLQYSLVYVNTVVGAMEEQFGIMDNEVRDPFKTLRTRLIQDAAYNGNRHVIQNGKVR